MSSSPVLDLPVSKIFQDDQDNLSDISLNDAKEMNVAKLFSKVVAFIDVRSSEDTKAATHLVAKLKNMNAKVAKKLTSKVTHMIFNSHSKENYEAAMNRNVFIVSPKWVFDSEKSGKREKEENYSTSIVVESSQEKKDKELSKKMTPVKHKIDSVKKRKRQDDENKENKRSRMNNNNDNMEDIDDNKSKKSNKSEKKTKNVSKISSKSDKGTKRSPRRKFEEHDWGSEGESEPEDVYDMSDNDWEDSFVRSPRRDPPKETAYTIEFSGAPDGWDEDEAIMQVKTLELQKRIKGGFKIGESPFSGHKFTHLVLGNENKRSLKVLYAIAFGAHIVTMKWWSAFLEHAEKEKANNSKNISVFSTDGYEIERWRKSVEACKKLNQDLSDLSMKEAKESGIGKLFNGLCISFHDCGENTELLERLVEILGGKSTRAHRRADICVVNVDGSPNETCLSAKCLVDLKWFSDSIEAFDALPTAKYGVDKSRIVDRKTPQPKEKSSMKPVEKKNKTNSQEKSEKTEKLNVGDESQKRSQKSSQK